MTTLSPTAPYHVADMSLAEWGKREIAIRSAHVARCGTRSAVETCATAAAVIEKHAVITSVARDLAVRGSNSEISRCARDDKTLIICNPDSV